MLKLSLDSPMDIKYTLFNLQSYIGPPLFSTGSLGRLSCALWPMCSPRSGGRWLVGAHCVAVRGSWQGGVDCKGIGAGGILLRRLRSFRTMLKSANPTLAPPEALDRCMPKPRPLFAQTILPNHLRPEPVSTEHTAATEATPNALNTTARRLSAFRAVNLEIPNPQKFSPEALNRETLWPNLRKPLCPPGPKPLNTYILNLESPRIASALWAT